ncbi:M64 family metallopeptidase [Longispora albida]|uniref:M64 family metallopeptidase n=1 Tax=Longispora albida TaxID=203523 RepID=UPI000372B31E|nr:M64 family metallopeptidase [Longispora albida]
MRVKLALVAGAVLALAATVLPGTGNTADRSTRTELMEVFSPDGSITRTKVKLPKVEAAAEPQALAAAEVVPIEVNGPSSSRFDLVFVGDGYTSSQMALYNSHVKSKWAEIAAFEPFKSHRTQFNVWQVNVISQQSGVDNDPTNGIRKNTALDMGFWCGGTERLLCVNQTKAKQYAAAVADVDQVLALGNSTKYGGAGGGVATASGGNAQSGQVAIHELGHSMGGLADEYTYGSGDCYPYGEPSESNVSKLTAAQMQSQQRKWYRWIGQVSPDGGTVGAYVGGRYYTRCINRPTDNSMMRSLGRQFNLPGREAMVASFYRESGVIEGFSSDSSNLWVKPVDGGSVEWRVDGAPLAGNGLAPAALPSGTHTVTATVTVHTDWVRDPELLKHLTQTVSWTVTR